MRMVSSIPILKNDKKTPILLPSGARLYADNVLAEFSHPPFSVVEEAPAIFQRIFNDIQRHIGGRYGLIAKAAHDYIPEELGPKIVLDERGQKVDSQAWKAGCEPNFNPYAMAENPKVAFTDGMRTGSFHVHMGHKKLAELEDKAEFIKLMDIYLGCASVLFDRDKSNERRRKYYGQAGEFRPTHYGVEYRVLGNYALQSPALVQLVFDIAVYCAWHLDRDTVRSITGIKGIQENAQKAINYNNTFTAEAVLDKAMFPSRLLARCHGGYEVKSMKEAWGLD